MRLLRVDGGDVTSDRETPEQAALHLLRTALGATAMFGPPSPHSPADFTGDDLVEMGCCGGWNGPTPGIECCTDCPVGARRQLFIAPSPHAAAELLDDEPGPLVFHAPAGPCTMPGCGGTCGFPEDEHDTVTYLSPDQATADAARALVERGRQEVAGAVCVRASGPLTDGDYAAVGAFAQQLEQQYAADRAPVAFLSPAPGNKAWQGDALWRELTEAVRLYSLEDPRSKQVEIGPSEIGHPCDARVLRTLLGVERFNVDADPWASFVGTAVHARLALVFDWMNKRLGREQYLIERKVYVSDGVFGSCDLFRDGIVIDHKIVGATTMKELERLGLEAKGGIYRVQGHAYGRGWKRAGERVDEVVIAAWPRSGFLTGLRLYREPFDEQVAVDALDRVSRLSASALEPGVDCDGDAFWETVPVKPSKQCGFCYWYDPSHDPDVPDRMHCGAARAVRQSAP